VVLKPDESGATVTMRILPMLLLADTKNPASAAKRISLMAVSRLFTDHELENLQPLEP
jgi:hypothetical protein